MNRRQAIMTSISALVMIPAAAESAPLTGRDEPWPWPHIGLVMDQAYADAHGGILDINRPEFWGGALCGVSLFGVMGDGRAIINEPGRAYTAAEWEMVKADVQPFLERRSARWRQEEAQRYGRAAQLWPNWTTHRDTQAPIGGTAE